MASYGNTATSTEVLSTIISANTNTDVDLAPDEGTNSFDSKGYNLIGDGNATSAFNQTGDQTNVSDPKLGALSENGGPTKTHALLVRSPAIDKGNTDLATDQRGEVRPFDDPTIAPAQGGDDSDIGSFEEQSVLNTAPEADNDAYSTNEDTTLTVAAPGVLANDTDPDTGDTLEAVLVSGPSHAASFTLNADGSFDYTPSANYNGPDSFTYKANDGSADSNTATVTITVNAANDAPTIAVLAGSASQSACLSDTRGRITLKLADVDNDVSALTLSVASSSNTRLVPKSNVSFGGSAETRTATITTVSGRIGSSSVTLKVSDSQASGSVGVTVKAGGNGENTLTGTGGADLLLGRDGEDALRGFGGSDVLCGAKGEDRLMGGSEADSFDGGSGKDAAPDFNAGEGDSKTNIP